MTAETTLILSFYLVLLAIATKYLWSYKVASPIFWYPQSLSLISIGIILQINFDHRSDTTHIIAMFIALLSFTIVSILYSKSVSLNKKIRLFVEKDIEDDTINTKYIVLSFFFISSVLTLIYYYNTGANIILLAIGTGLIDDYSTIRLGMYSGEKYLGAGYYNQFKNILLPLSCSVLYIYNLKYRVLNRKLLASIFIIFCLYAVAGTGQRTYLVYSFFAIYFGFLLLYIKKSRTINKRFIFGIFVLFILFSSMTSLYKDTSDDIVHSIGLSIERIFYTQQWTGLVAFQIIYDKPITWLGEWYESIKGILPNHRGSELSNEIHDVMFASYRGTAPPTLIGSAYHNGGLWLVTVTFIILGYAYSWLYHRFVKGRKTPARCMGYGSLFFYLITFFVSTPKYLFDNGVVAILLFLFIIRRKS